MNNVKQVLAVFLLFFVIIAGIVSGSKALCEYAKEYHVTFADELDELFRAQRISDKAMDRVAELCEEEDVFVAEMLGAYMAVNNMKLEDKTVITKKQYENIHRYLLKYYKKDYEELVDLYSKIWQDAQFFPVPESDLNKQAKVSFENSWMYERSYGGKRGHEGTDIMASINERGYYPIVSMTNGVIEKIGWLEKGGYRIGIRSSQGGYYYYAHLSEYAQDFQIGEEIQAGQLIGYMGDSGYGPEGTVGQFAVHLHVGIYFDGEDGREISVNPYPLLRYLEKKKLQYDY